MELCEAAEMLESPEADYWKTLLRIKDLATRNGSHEFQEAIQTEIERERGWANSAFKKKDGKLIFKNLIGEK